MLPCSRLTAIGDDTISETEMSALSFLLEQYGQRKSKFLCINRLTVSFSVWMDQFGYCEECNFFFREPCRSFLSVADDNLITRLSLADLLEILENEILNQVKSCCNLRAQTGNVHR